MARNTLLLGCCAACLAACSPAFNWRQVSHSGTSAQAMMPCKPERAERDVPLLGPQSPSVQLQLMGCEAGDLHFAFAVARLPEGADAQGAVRLWQQAAWASLQLKAEAATGPSSQQNGIEATPKPTGWIPVPYTIKGASLAHHWQGPGLDHRGQALKADLVWAVRGPWLVHAAVYGADASPEARETFLAGIQWP